MQVYSGCWRIGLFADTLVQHLQPQSLHYPCLLSADMSGGFKYFWDKKELLVHADSHSNIRRFAQTCSFRIWSSALSPFSPHQNIHDTADIETCLQDPKHREALIPLDITFLDPPTTGAVGSLSDLKSTSESTGSWRVR